MTVDEPDAGESPKPAPRPGPPRPSPRPHPPVQPVAVPPSSDPHRFGRIDDDGTVYLITATGERAIGSWQAGDPEAAYAHFGRRFDDLATEITLMETRLASGTGDARKIKTAAAALAETLPTAHVLGDVDALADRLAAIRDHAKDEKKALKDFKADVDKLDEDDDDFADQLFDILQDVEEHDLRDRLEDIDENDVDDLIDLIDEDEDCASVLFSS